MKNSKIRLIFLENLKNNIQLLSTFTLAEILKFIKKKKKIKLQFFKIGDYVTYRIMTFYEFEVFNATKIGLLD